MDRAYSFITIKAVDEDKRIIRGIATTPTPDRMGDIVEPKGAEFQLPIPMLWQHMSSQPIGHVVEAKVSKDGIEIVAEIAKMDEPGKLKDRLDEAWQSLKSGLVRGLSIGFKGLETSRLEDGYSLRFIKWLWLELSAVTIPANGEATITALKSVSSEQLAASGQRLVGAVRLVLPGASGSVKTSVKPKEGEEMNIAEQIKALEATRAAKVAALEKLTKRSVDAGETMNAQEREEFDTLKGEIEAVDGDLKRLRDLEKIVAASATPVTAKDNKSGTDNRVPVNDRIQVVAPKLLPGIRMARVVRCLALAQGNRWGAGQIAEQLFGKTDPVVVSVLKATVAAGTTASGNWAEGLVGEESAVFADFVEFLRPQTIIGKFGTNGIPSLRTVPFRTALVGQTGGGNGYWVGEGKAKPLTNFDFSRTTLEPLKVAAIAVLTEELIRDSSPSAELITRDSLVAALRERLDLDFINPDKAASAGVSPASILNGITALVSSGSDADSVRADIRKLFAAFIAANNAPTTGVWIMSANTALALSLMMNPLGQPEFPGINMNGGTLFGLPVITSEYVTPNTTGDFVALVNAQDIYISDDGGFQVDLSREASLEMSDAPAHNSDTPTAAQLVSMFQTNSVAFRAERTINWKRRRESAAAWVAGVTWGQAVT